MKRTPLKRKTPMPRQRTRMRARGNTKYRRRERYVEYMVAVKGFPCVARDMGGCDGQVQADHAGRRGLGQKCHDREVIPLCAHHHRQRADFAGPFREWPQAQMRTWLADATAATQAMAIAKGVTVP